MKRRLLLTACCVIAALTSVGNTPRAASAQPKGRALLVGINEYRHAPAVKPTRGAQEDATETARFIQTQYGFRADEIQTLLGPNATADKIKATFKSWLIDGTEPDDRVFFLYAGHGSQMKDANGDEEDGLDEVLAPYDVNWQGNGFVNVITDDELEVLLKQLSGRQVVMVFDSCNSGTISRSTPGAQITRNGHGDARYLPSPEEAMQLGLGVGTRGGPAADYVVNDDARLLRHKSGAPAAAQERDLKWVDLKLQSTDMRMVIFSAAQSAQAAYSLKIGNQDRGALSYAFYAAHRERDPKLSELRRSITAQITQWQQHAQLRGQQQPAVEIISASSLEEDPLFAAAPNVPAIAFANPQSALRVTLRTLDGKRVYRIDDKIAYEVTTSAPGWLYLLVFSQEQKATCVFPTNENADDRDNHLLRPGTYRLPRSKYFYARPPIGRDVVVALLSSVPLKLGDQEELTWQEVFDRLRSNKLTGYVNTRGVGTKPSAPSPNAPQPKSLDEADWQAASLVMETIAQADERAPAANKPASRSNRVSSKPNRPQQR